MDPTHLHLLITHLPIYGSILRALVLAFALWTKNNNTMVAAYLLFVISAIGAGIAYSTGEAAEETVEGIKFIAENKIEQHEDFAIYALWGFITLGLASLIGIFFSLKKLGGTKFVGFVVLLIALVSFGLVAYTGYLGGQIRKTEIGDSSHSTKTFYQENNDDD